MQVWQTKIQKRTAINVKLTALFVCIVHTVATKLKAIFCRSKNTEEAKPPVDYERKHWHKYDWEKWIQNNKDEWN